MGFRRPAGSIGGRLPLVLGAAVLPLVVAVAAWALTGSSPEESDSPSSAVTAAGPTEHELSDREAIASFERLDSLRIKAYEKADPGLLTRVFTQGGPAYGNARREVELLKRDGVRSRSAFETLSIEVVSNTPETIHLRQDVVLTPSFVDPSGRDVAGHAAKERRIVDWIMVWTGERWLFEDARVTELGEP